MRVETHFAATFVMVVSAPSITTVSPESFRISLTIPPLRSSSLDSTRLSWLRYHLILLKISYFIFKSLSLGKGFAFKKTSGSLTLYFSIFRFSQSKYLNKPALRCAFLMQSVFILGFSQYFLLSYFLLVKLFYCFFPNLILFIPIPSYGWRRGRVGLFGRSR